MNFISIFREYLAWKSLLLQPVAEDSSVSLLLGHPVVDSSRSGAQSLFGMHGGALLQHSKSAVFAALTSSYLFILR